MPHHFWVSVYLIKLEKLKKKFIVPLAYWGNGRDSAASMPFSPFAGGMGMMPGGSGFDKNSSAAQQANSMNASMR